MKIKNDFVTNSSSCSYIVCIPDVHDFLEKVEKEIKLPDEIKYLFFEKNMHFPCDKESDFKNFYRYHNVIDKLGYVIEFEDYGPDNVPRYINIANNQEKIIQLKKILGD